MCPGPFPVPEELTPRDLPLLEPTVHGFDLRTHEWRHLYVAGLEEVKWNSHAFDDLILDENEKELLLGSVQSATARETTVGGGRSGEADESAVTTTAPPQPKRPSGGGGGEAAAGGGSVYLFHGGPGTGKTFAASCMSERTRKPLYHMTPFATGVSAEAVQRNMDAALALAQRWDCMLVLEDADATAHGGGAGSGGSGSGSLVQHEVPRRAMTMALLKLLDSFGGIVLLNSSRVDVLDDALFSRVHLAIHFPELDAAGRRSIWRDALSAASLPSPTACSVPAGTGIDGSRSSDADAADNTPAEGGGLGAAGTVAAAATSGSAIDPYLLTPEAEQTLAAVALDGREIRNVAAQSLRIARFRGEVLRLELVESVLRQAVKLREHRASLVPGKRDLPAKISTDGGIRDGAKAIKGSGWAWPE